MSPAYYNEFDPKAAAWLRELIKAGHLAPGYVDERSITEVQPSDLTPYAQCHFFAGIGGWSLALRMAGVPDEAPVWTGSCPCQPFSSAGQKKGASDDRHLWPVFSRLISERRPHCVFGEQIARAVGYNWLDGVCADLEAQDYAVGSCVLGAHSAGRCHTRQRLFWCAFTHSERVQQPRQEPCSWQIGRVGWTGESLAWNTDWQSALSQLRAMDDGLSYGVEACDGPRNAIVPQVAAEFIKASLEAIKEVQR